MTTPNPAELPADRLRAALTAGARASGQANVQAAVHLLNGTELPGSSVFAPHVKLWQDTGRDMTTVLCAAVEDWPDVLDSGQIFFSDTEWQFMRLAASMAAGEMVDLRDCLAGLDLDHARRVIEAVIMAAGTVGYWELKKGDKLERLENLPDSSTFGEQ